MGLRGVVAADGARHGAVIWGKVKTNVQFFAILLAIVRPDVVIAGAYVDEWLMVAAAIITVASAVDYLRSFGSALCAARCPRSGRGGDAGGAGDGPAPARAASAQPTLHSAP